jgi:hypothetical protein
MANLETLHAAEIGGTLIPGVTDYAANPGVETTRPITDGDTLSTKTSEISNAPEMTVTTLAIATALTKLGGGSGRGVIGPVTLWNLKRDATGEIASGTVHSKQVLSEAISVPDSLRIDQSGNAALSFRSLGYNASDEPLQWLTGEAAPAALVRESSYYGLGPFNIGAQEILSKVNWTLSWQPGFHPPYQTDGEPQPQAQALSAVLPILTLELLDGDMAAYLMGGGAGTWKSPKALPDPLIFYLRKRVEGTGYVGDATPEHVKFTVAEGTVRWDGSSGNPRSHRFTVEPTAQTDGTPALVYSGASAIT